MRRNQSPLASPVLIGAVTVLVVLVAVFIAYNANEGLPFVPTQELKVDIADGANIVVGNDVTEGGTRIGQVTALQPIRLKSGKVVAQMTLQLTRSDGRIPVDSTATISSRSVLGEKFVALNLGTASRDIINGGTLPLRQTSVPVQLDDIFDSFTPPTRTAIQRTLVGAGDTLASRGPDLNETLQDLPPLLRNLTPVAAYLQAPTTELLRFVDSLNGLTSTLQPVGTTLVELMKDSATTFAAIAHDPQSLETTIARSPSTLQVSTSSLRTQQPFLADLTTLGHDLTPATQALKQSLPDINPAIEQGTRVLGRTPVLDRGLTDVNDQLKTLATAPSTNMAINGLTSTVDILDPMIRYLGPFITVCNDWNYWFTYLAGDLDEQTTFGYAQRALLNQTNPLQPNNIGTQGATAPVDGGVPNSPLGGDEYIHGQAYGAAVDTSGNADCETGQRGYVKKLNYFDPQGRDFATDAHTPGDQGPTFTGRARVPKGETYDRSPSTGPQLPNVPGNS